MAAGLAGDHAGEGGLETVGGVGIGEEEARVGAAFPIQAVVFQRLEFLDVFHGVENAFLLGAHGFDHAGEAVKLDVEDGAFDFGGAGASGREQRDGLLTAGPVELAAVDHAADAHRRVVVVRDGRAAFACAHVLVIVEAEGADIADAAAHAAFVGAADALAGVFDHQQVVLFSDRHQGVHVADKAPHMDGDDSLRVRADGGFDGLRIKRQRIIDIDDDGNGADGENGDGGCDVGAGGHEDFVARADFQTGEGGVEGDRAAGVQHNVFDAKVFSIAFLKCFAGVADAVAEKLSSSDDFCDGVDFFLTDFVHGVNLVKMVVVMVKNRFPINKDTE